MKKYYRLKNMRKGLILSASFLFALSACKKEGELIPDFEESTTFVFFYDTTHVETTTRLGEPVRADGISTGLVGTYRDSAFGKVISNVYVQPQLPTNELIFGDTIENVDVDSVILSFDYSDHFGDTSIVQTIEAFRLTETLVDTAGFLSNTVIPVNPNPIGSLTFSPQPTTDITINQPNLIGGLDTLTLSSQLRIPLDKALGEEIVSKQGGSELANSTNFLNYFQGIKLAPQEGTTVMNNQAAILYLRLTAANTKMTIYYTYRNGGTVENRAVDFPINSSSIRFNTFTHDYTGSAVETIVQNPSQPSPFAYTEAMAGVETNIKFTSLKDELPSNVLINKAELILPVANGSYDQFGKAESVILASRDPENGDLQFIPDFFESESYFGGDLDVDDNNGEEFYRFNIARYIQSYLNGGQNDLGLTVLVTGSAVKAERAVFLTENNADKKIRLNLYYTNTQ